MDSFFTQTTCDRCGGSLDGGRMMSKFNEDCLCKGCISKEKEHPDYNAAQDADHEAIKRGDYNFKGIGYNE